MYVLLARFDGERRGDEGFGKRDEFFEPQDIHMCRYWKQAWSEQRRRISLERGEGFFSICKSFDVIAESAHLKHAIDIIR